MFWDCALLPILVALIGSFLLALIECGAAAWLSVPNLQMKTWPMGIVVSAFGKMALTHMFLWAPILMVAAVLLRPLIRRQPGAPPEAVLCGLMAVLGGCLVFPLDLEMAGRKSATILGAACLASCITGAALFIALRWIAGKRGRTLLKRIIGMGASLCAVATLGPALTFVQSPLYDPAGYRVKTNATTRAKHDRPDVLWIVLDTVRGDRVANANEHSATTAPFMSEWARDSIVFERAISNAMWTVPSHASMFTGLSVREHGTDGEHLILHSSRGTIAEWLAKAGYATASFSNNPWISRDTNLARGFEDCCVATYLRHLTRFSLEYGLEKLGIVPPLPWLDSDYGAALTNRLAHQWLREQESGRPIFLFVNYMEAHLPCRVPRPYREEFMSDRQVKRSYALRRRAYGDIAEELNHRFNIEGPEFIVPDDRDILKRQYDASVQYLDDRVRELIEVFGRQRGLENTLIIIASDHGEYLDTHGMWSHCFLTYQELARVVLLIRPPRESTGTRCRSPVQLSDLYATVADTVSKGEASSPSETGTNLIEFARTGNPDRVAVTEFWGGNPALRSRIRRVNSPEVSHRAQGQIAIQDARYKYMLSRDGTRELYDLLEDPREQNNLIDVFVEEAARLQSQLDAWLFSTPLFQPGSEAGTLNLDNTAIEALRGLGYINR